MSRTAFVGLSALVAGTLAFASALVPVAADGLSKQVGDRKCSATRLKTSNAVAGINVGNPRKAALSLGGAGEKPFKEITEGVQLYGSVIDSDGLNVGLYNITSSGSMTFKFAGPKAVGAVLKDGKYIAAMPGSWSANPTIKVYDFETGVLLDSWSQANNRYSCFGMDTDPVSGDIYGAFYDEDGYDVELCKVSFNGATPTIEQVIGTISTDKVWYGFAIDPEGQFYGIMDNDSYNTQAALYKINRNTGSPTKVGDTGIYAYYNTDCVFDPESGTLYWTAADYNDDGFLCTVNTATGKATKIAALSGDPQIGGLVIPRAATVDPKAPAECTLLGVDFQASSLTGTVKVKTPSVFHDGTEGNGPLQVVVQGNNDTELARCDAQWGADTEVSITVPEAGKTNFKVFASNNNGDSKPININGVFVGPDHPVAPASATLVYEEGKMKLTWTSVTESVNGGYVDAAGMKYNVTRYPGAETAAQLTGATSFEEDFPEPQALTRVYYKVTAVSENLESAAVTSNAIQLGSITPPYTSYYNGGISDYTVIDANGDGNKWVLDSGGYMSIAYNSNMDMDDWFITPAILLEGGKSYNVKIPVKAHSSSYPERIEVKFGSEPTVDAMTGTVLAPASVTWTTNFKSLEGTLVCPASGRYYIGFHGISDEDMHHLYLDDFTIEAGVEAAVPLAPTELEVTPAADCSLKATVSFKAPELDITNTPLASLVKVEVLRNGDVVRTFETIAPGETKSFEDEVDQLGDYAYSVLAYNEYGAGAAADTVVYIGVRKPAAPANVRLVRTANEGEVTASWSTVTKDVEDNDLNPSLVKYVVAEYITDGWYAVSEQLTGNVYTFQAVAAGNPQQFVQYAVFAVTDAGSNGAVTDMIPAGQPYDAIHEHCAEATLAYAWMTDNSQGGTWGLYQDNSSVSAPDGDGYMLGLKGDYKNNAGDLISARVSLSSDEVPSINFMVYNPSTADNGANANIVTVAVRPDGAAAYTTVLEKTVQQLASPKSWGKVHIDLSDYKGKTVQVKFTVNVQQYATTLFDAINVENAEIILPVPANLTAQTSEGLVELAWDEPEFVKGQFITSDHLTGYNVYRDDELLTYDPVTTNGHQDTTVGVDSAAGETSKLYSYHVTALYTHGESNPSEKFEVVYAPSSVAGIFSGKGVTAGNGEISICGFDGKEAVVADASGALLYKGKVAAVTIVKAAAGIHVVTVNGQTWKVIVK